MTAYSTLILADSPVGYWHLNDASGSTATDSSGSTRNGTYNNTGNITYQAASANAALDDDKCITTASTGNVSVADNNVWSMNNANAFTVEVWVNLTGGTSSTWFNIISKDSTPNQYEWWLYFDGTSRFVWETVNITNAGGSLYTRKSSASYTTSTWYHVVVTCAGAPGSTAPSMYVNGVLDNNSLTGTGGTYTNGTSGLEMMFRSIAGSTQTHGKIDEVAIYNTALSATQVANHYNAGLGNATATPPVATTTNYAGLVPVLAVPTILPPVATTTNYVGLVPAYTSSSTATPPVASTTNYAGYIPVVNGNAAMNAPLGTYTMLGLAPTFVNTVTPPVGAITLAGLDAVIHTAIYTKVVLQDNPWLYWHLDEAAGTSSILDYSGNHRDGTVTGAGTVSLPAGAVFGDNALDFDNGAYVTSPTTNPTIDPLSTRNWSLEFWTKISANNSAELSFYNQDNSISPSRQLGGMDILIRRDQNTVNISLLSEYPDNTSMVDWPPASVGLTDDWSHWVVTLSVTQTSPQHYNVIATVYFNGIGVINLNQNFISSIASFGFPMAGNSSFGVGKFINSPPYSLSGISIDELAVYNYTLTANQAHIHYNAGVGAGASLDVTVTPPSNTVSYIGLAPASVAHTPVTVVQPAPVTINYVAINPTISTSTGSVTVLLNTVNLNYAGLTAQISAAIQNINVVVLPGTLEVAAFAPIIIPDFIASAFRFVKNDYTGFTALDANYQSTMDAGPLFHSQKKIISFRLANLSPSISYFTVKAFASAELTVEFSLNNVDWFPSVDLKVIKPNAVTDMIYCRITVSDLATIGSGNYLIDVDQTYA